MSMDVMVRWSNPGQTVDERLLLRSSGEARLLALSPLTLADQIGEFRGTATADEYAVLSSAGPAVQVDPTHNAPELAEVAVLATEVADRCREHPWSVAHIFLRPTGPPAAGRQPLALGVVGEGDQPCEFLLDLPACRVRFWSGSGELIVESEFPALVTGFATVDAEGLGGVGQRALVPPGVLGAIALDLLVPVGAAITEVVLTGLWFAAADEGSDAVPPDRFTARAVADLQF
ncbi:MAG: hypothetical protein WCF36_22030 [Candidatus Nanopelagicales bacterium]